MYEKWEASGKATLDFLGSWTPLIETHADSPRFERDAARQRRFLSELWPSGARAQYWQPPDRYALRHVERQREKALTRKGVAIRRQRHYHEQAAGGAGDAPDA